MKHILIADDVLQNRLLLKDILMQKGFLVSCCHSPCLSAFEWFFLVLHGGVLG